MSESIEASARGTRAIRGVLAASVATLVALVGHVSGGGAVPSPVLVGATLVLSWLPGIALIGVRPRLWRQAATIIVAQAMLHGLFTLESMAGASGGLSSSLVRPTAPMPGMGDVLSAVHVPANSASAMAGMSPGWPMWVGHAVAALVTIAAWRHGESCCAAVLRIARAGLQRLARIGYGCALLIFPALAAVPALASPIRVRMRAHAGVSRRGPPASIAIALRS